jgi:hypothetical protein
MLAGMTGTGNVGLRHQLRAIALAAVIAVALTLAPMLLDGAWDASVVPAASACCGQSGSGG